MFKEKQTLKKGINKDQHIVTTNQKLEFKTMEIIRGKEFTANTAWSGRDIANMNGIKTKLRWTDQPYKWHTNNGEEVFVVLDGIVEMFYKESGVEKSALLNAGDIFFASVGTEHFAHPKGEARLLIVEDETSE